MTLPLALHGVVAKKDGSIVEINVGENEDDPVFFISDLLVHLSGEQMEKKAAKVVEGEALDRVCAYTSLMAMLEIGQTERTACCILVDKEEIGSVGATGMQSRFFENTVAEVMELAGEYSELNVRRCLAASNMLSSDVSAASRKRTPHFSAAAWYSTSLPAQEASPAPTMQTQNMWRTSARSWTRRALRSRPQSLARLT